MEELKAEAKNKIESFLYPKVLEILESQYNSEGIIDINKKNSTKIIYKDKKSAMKDILKEIKEFALENNLNINDIKDYLLQIIQENMRINSMFQLEYKKMQEVILTKEDDKDTREI